MTTTIISFLQQILNSWQKKQIKRSTGNQKHSLQDNNATSHKEVIGYISMEDLQQVSWSPYSLCQSRTRNYVHYHDDSLYFVDHGRAQAKYYLLNSRN